MEVFLNVAESIAQAQALTLERLDIQYNRTEKCWFAYAYFEWKGKTKTFAYTYKIMQEGRFYECDR